jgi:hypothetical protein
MITPILTTIAALGLAAAPAPAPVALRRAVADTPAHEQQVTVRVRNDNFSDMDVYAFSQGMTWRLGTVPSMQRTTFTLPQEMVAPQAEVRLIFAPIAGWHYWVSPPVLVSPGDSVRSDIGSMLDLSTVTPT